MEFKEWLKNIDENMWGNTPCKTRKPSDGWGGNKGGEDMPMQQQHIITRSQLARLQLLLDCMIQRYGI